VQRVREGGGDVDEFTLLCRARQRLQQGREYRAVRPGPTFTRRVMSGIEEEAAQVKKGLPWASVIAGGLLVAMLLAIVGVAYLLISPAGDRSSELKLLQGTFTTLAAERLPVANLPADEPFAIELQRPTEASGEISRAVTISAGGQRAVFSWEDGVARLDSGPAGSLATTIDEQTQIVRLVIGPTLAKIQLDGKTAATGEHHLPAGAPRAIVEERPEATTAPSQRALPSIRILTR
jgi:hypothetical protein